MALVARPPWRSPVIGNGTTIHGGRKIQNVPLYYFDTPGPEFGLETPKILMKMTRKYANPFGFPPFFIENGYLSHSRRRSAKVRVLYLFLLIFLVIYKNKNKYSKIKKEKKKESPFSLEVVFLLILCVKNIQIYVCGFIAEFFTIFAFFLLCFFFSMLLFVFFIGTEVQRQHGGTRREAYGGCWWLLRAPSN